MRNVIIFITFFFISLPVYAQKNAWVSVDSLNRRTCPSSSCGIVGILKYREKVTISERKKGWVRITKYYDAACSNGYSQYVDEGNKVCKPSNGIKNGIFAEWVFAKHLVNKQPADPALKASTNYSLVKDSDDFRKYKNAFAKAASNLIATGKCSASDFLNMGGWMKSSNHRNQPIYFTYCGGMRIQNKVYLNAETGVINR